jgi:hypothetical protein
VTDPLTEAAEAAEQARTWLARRDDAIRRARGSASLRQIAARVGLTHAAVDKIAKR